MVITLPWVGVEPPVDQASSTHPSASSINGICAKSSSRAAWTNAAGAGKMVIFPSNQFGIWGKKHGNLCIYIYTYICIYSHIVGVCVFMVDKLAYN